LNVLTLTTESDKDGLESKFELVQLILAGFKRHPELAYLVSGDEGINMLTRHVAAGPFYARSEAKVAFESS
jgi:hypothetical protein